MLEVQKFLKTRSLNDLEKFSIRITPHPSEPLVILNYDQVKSPKAHAIVRECRGLVLHVDGSLVARSFNRFFNLGEHKADAKKFDWGNFISQSKEDGSLILIYHYDGKWRINSRGSFGQSPVNDSPYTWWTLTEEALGDSIQKIGESLDKEITYVCELVSPYNQEVRFYDKPELYFLTAFHRDEGELSHADGRELGQKLPVTLLDLYDFTSSDEVTRFLKALEREDPTHEGVVLRDCNNVRFKTKNLSWLRLHRIHNNGNVIKPKNLVPLILTGERDEILTYFPKLKSAFDKCQSKLDKTYNELKQIWVESHKIEEQKDFALSITNRTPLAGLLFRLRNEVGINDLALDRLHELWLESDDLIVKRLYKDVNSL